VIPVLKWPSFIASLGDWSSFVPSLTWFSFVSDISWESFVPDMGWGDFIPRLFGGGGGSPNGGADVQSIGAWVGALRTVRLPENVRT